MAMESISKQPKWNIHEAVILLDAYLKFLQCKSSKRKIIRTVSTELRQMAINQGIIINDTYRNENGVSYQIQSMESAYKGRKISIPATKLFEKTVSLYHENRHRYDQLLNEAKNMIMPQHNNKDNFLLWANDNLPETRIKWIEENLLKIERFANTLGLINQAIFDVIDRSTLNRIFNCIEKNKIFQIKNRRFIKNITEDFKSYIQFCLKKETPINNVPTITSDKTNNDIVTVLKQHYKYGFKYNSYRELMRFRQFADAMGVTLPEEDEALKASILSSGTIIDDKVYCKSNDMLKELQHVVDDAFSSGAGTIYYESLFKKEQEWMESHVITSPDMLRKYLQNNIAGCYFSKNFMVKGNRCSEKEAITNELKRIWGTHPVESVHKLNEYLPYIPSENIWRVISGNDLFVWTAEGEYLFIDRFRITKDEEEDILDFVDEICEENGFASLCDVPLGNIEEENYELTQTAIYNAIYKKTLSGKYHLNGKILTKGKSELNAVMLLKQYIKDKDECTFDEVANKVVKLTGSINRQYAFQALYDDMVRVDRNHFVSTQLVDFSVDEIDNALSVFITDNFRAIRDVTTFAAFPLCGQNWNHYLLESFCYRYSKKYKLHVINFNDKNAGIIVDNNFNAKYNEMLAIAIARTNVELSPEVIGQYLFNTGYLAKRKYANLGEIAQRAMELRKGR